MNSTEEAYKAYPLNDVNKYDVETNAKRLGFQQGYDKCKKDCAELTVQFLRNDSRAKYMLEMDWEILEDLKNTIEKD